MSLREEIAAKMVNIFMPRVTDALPYEQLHQWQKEPWLKLADEAIRQMEWARRHRADKDINNGFKVEPSAELLERAKTDRRVCTSSYYEFPYVPLTLAPEDWSPHA